MYLQSTVIFGLFEGRPISLKQVVPLQQEQPQQPFWSRGCVRVERCVCRYVAFRGC